MLKHSLNILIISGLFPLFFGCASTQYFEPIPLTQDEIKNIKVIDNHGREEELSATRIRDCSTFAKASKECSIIICKNISDKEKKYTCEYYIPKTDNEKENKTVEKYIEVFKLQQKQIAKRKQIESETPEKKALLLKLEDIKKDLLNDKMKSLNDLCSEPLVACYLDKKYYPEGHVSSVPDGLPEYFKYSYDFKSKANKYYRHVEILFY